jgi:tripartite-type tricarboxylate transporter receptor subunit TctC
MRRIRIACAFAGAALVASAAALAQSPADFYKGKNVDLYIGYSAAGGYDVYARLLARHMGNHIPGKPKIVTKNIAPQPAAALPARSAGTWRTAWESEQ